MTTPACICGHSWAWHDPRCLACACDGWHQVARGMFNNHPQAAIADQPLRFTTTDQEGR